MCSTPCTLLQTRDGAPIRETTYGSGGNPGNPVAQQHEVVVLAASFLSFSGFLIVAGEPDASASNTRRSTEGLLTVRPLAPLLPMIGEILPVGLSANVL